MNIYHHNIRNKTNNIFTYSIILKMILISIITILSSVSIAFCQNEAVLSVAPANRDVNFTSGSTTFSVNNTGSGTMTWTASESSDWVILPTNSGTNTGTITATYQANNSTSPRTCTISVTASGATGSPQNITITQAGTAPVLSINPSNRSVSINSGSTTFSVTNTGSGTMTWTASESSDWVTLPTSSGTNTGTITATYQANNSTSSRSCTITVISSDAKNSPQNIIITQVGTTPVLSVTPNSRDIGYTSGTTTFSVSNTGSGAMTWTASVSSNWITLSDSSGTNSGTITATYQANNSTSQRTCTITIAASEATGSPQNITITQAGTSPVLSVSPINRDMSYTAGSTTFSVTNTGNGAMNWTATESSDWVTLSDSNGTNTGIITATFQANSSASSRTCIITVTASGASGSPQNVTITQAGTTPVLSVTPSNRSVNYTSGSTTFSVSNTGNGAMNWSASTSSDWVTLPGNSGTNTGTITATYQANNSTSSRTCTITVTASGANDSPQSITITQVGTTPVLLVAPINREMSYTAGSTTFLVTNTGSGTMTWTASESSDWVTLSDKSGTNTGTIIATFLDNNSISPRTCIITVTAPDASGNPLNVTINQAGTSPALTVTPSSRDVSYTFGSATFSVSNTGSGTLTWNASESSDWVTLSGNSGTNSGTITATYLANSSISPRSCKITITASDATGSPREVTINQAGTAPVLTVTPISRDVGNTSGLTTFSVSNTGSGTMTWAATESSDWVTLSDSSGTNIGNITATYQANSSTSSRTCIIIVTAPDATGSPRNITINQAGTKAVLTVAPANRDVGGASGSTTFVVSNTGSGTMTWKASESSDWVTLSDSSGINTGTIIAKYKANSSSKPRPCIITVTASDSASEATNSPIEITILQQAQINTTNSQTGKKWFSSNIIASKVQEDFTGFVGIKRLSNISKCEINENPDIKPLPIIIASTASNVFQIEPRGRFNRPVYIKIPINPGKKTVNLSIYYYSESPTHSGWYRGENVAGWIVPGSARIQSENGQTFYECAINHSGIVQVGETKQVSLGGVANLDFGIAGSSEGWRAFTGVLILLCVGLVSVVRKYHPDKHYRKYSK